MKLRTIGQLDDAIDEEIAWRKRELSMARLAVGRAKSREADYLIRSGIALTYAHWEGWIKSVSQLYLEFVNQQRLTYSQMAPAILGGALKTKITDLGNAGKSAGHAAFAQFLVQGMGDRGKLGPDLIRTESNLSSRVLENILIRIGLDGQIFSMRNQFIDSELVERRNKIAHGNRLDVNQEEFEQLSKEVQKMLDDFTDRVRNLAATGAFRVA